MKGSCLCKAVEYEVKQLDTPIEHCSCVTCRKAHSAAFNTGVGIYPENFKWLKGESELSAYESSVGKMRYFCKNCGSHLLAIKEGNPFYILRIASLADDPKAVPEARIWKSHEVSWLNYSDDIPEYAEQEKTGHKVDRRYHCDGCTVISLT